jgi:DNA-binding transcriptional LysR family regulator
MAFDIRRARPPRAVVRAYACAVEIRYLRSFLVLAEELHFGRAAARLHVTPSAVSQELKALETELGLRLVERTTHHVDGLTDAGRRLVVEATAVLERVDEAMAAMARVRTSQVGGLVLGVSAGVDPTLLAALLATATAGGGDVDIQPRRVTSAEAIPALARNELDAALIQSIPTEPDVSHLVVISEEIGVALPSGHRLAQRRSAVRAAELNGEPIAAYQRRRAEPMLYDGIVSQLVDAGFEPGPPQDMPTVESALSLVAEGEATVISFRFAREVTRTRHNGVVWRRFADATVRVPTVLVWCTNKRSTPLTSLVQAARDLAVASAKASV